MSLLDMSDTIGRKLAVNIRLVEEVDNQDEKVVGGKSRSNLISVGHWYLLSTSSAGKKALSRLS